MSNSYVIYEKQPATNYETRVQWILRCYSTIMFWCTPPPSFSKNWWNTAMMYYHTHHILRTLSHATFCAWLKKTLCDDHFDNAQNVKAASVKVLCLTEGEAFQNCFQDPYTSCQRWIRVDGNDSVGVFIKCLPCSTKCSPELVSREPSD
jgi:hypothetical protein